MNNKIDMQQSWDVIVIGGGMGGGSAAYGLAKAGHQVLLVEKGLSEYPDASIEGTYRETPDPEKRLREGRWPTKLECKVNNVSSTIWPPLGCGLGGSSLLYGAALERLEASDFEPRQTPGGETIGWPYSYDELQPYYLEAEKLYSVCGTQDQLDTHSQYALKPPPAMSDCDRHLYQAMQAANLHPYRVHVGIKYQKDCLECGGYYCKQECKKDSRNSCIKPALATGNLTVMDQTELEKIEADDKTVKEVIVNRNGERISLTAKIVVLAAGAYFTPVLLQRSSNSHWPKGIGNNHDLVGRFLMFHASDFIAIWPKEKLSRVGPQKTIAFRDLYSHNDMRLGELQSTGLTAGYGNILYFLKLKFDQSPFRKLRFLRPFLRIPAKIAAWLFSEATVFATIVEDQPYADNRVLYDPNALSTMRFEYKVRGELEERVKLFRKLFRKILHTHRMFSLNEDVSLNYGHPCGTCRAGSSPENSVVDADCKVHELDNLYLADGSFMPSSGGTNPSLTIAANALRVAAKISQKLKQGAN